MAWRFRKSIKIAKGINLNLSKSGLGMSVGPKGMKVGMNSRGTYTSTRLPGTGLYSMNYLGSKSKASGKVSRGNISGTSGCLSIIGFLMVFGLLIVYPKTITTLLILVGIGWLIYWTQPKQKSKRLVKKGIVKFNQSEFEDAIYYFTAAEQADQSNTEAVRYLGMSYYQVKQYDKVIEYLGRFDSQSEIEQIMYANALNETGQHDQAIQLMQGFSPASELYLKSLIILADSFIKQKHFDIALETLKKAPLSKKNVDPELLYIFYLLGDVYAAKDDNKNALKYYNKVRATDVNYKDTETKIAELTR